MSWAILLGLIPFAAAFRTSSTHFSGSFAKTALRMLLSDSLSGMPRRPITSLWVILSSKDTVSWSSRLRESLMLPSDSLAIRYRVSESIFIFSAFVIFSSDSFIFSTGIFLKSYLWQRDMIVGGTLCASVVASMKIACSGGSSIILRRALKADWESMCTSSIM